MLWMRFYVTQERKLSYKKLDYPDSVGVDLMRLRGNFQHLSTDKAFMEGLRHSMAELDMEAILSLVQQLMLYLRNAIRSNNKVMPTLHTVVLSVHLAVEGGECRASFEF